MKIRLILFSLFFIPLCGCGLMGWGWFDYEESRTASDKPDKLELADLEGGKQVGNNHVQLGQHVACYYASVFTYSKSKYDPKDKSEDPNTSITESFYPIVSTSDPAVKKIEELKKEYGSINNIPKGVEIPVPARFAVVVKTSRFKKVGDINSLDGIRSEPQVQGLILNHSKLTGEEKKLLQDEFPSMNLDKVLILEEGRTPSSAAWCFARVAMGVCVILLGFFIAGVTTILAIRGR